MNGTSTARIAAWIGRGGLVTLALVAVVGVVASRSASGASPNCAAVAEGSISENPSFTPYAARRSRLPPQPLNPHGLPLTTLPANAGRVPDVLDGLPLRWAAVMDSGAEYRYYSRTPVTTATRVNDIWQGGGVELHLEPVTGDESFPEYLLAEFPDRVTRVQVGPWTAALVWADPDANGVRTHRLYWSDGRQTFGLIAERSAAQAVNLARRIACG